MLNEVFTPEVYIKMSLDKRFYLFLHSYWPRVSYKIWSNLQTYLWTDQSKDVVMLKLFTTGTTLYPTPWWSPVFPSQTQILFANIFSKYVIDWSQSCNLALSQCNKEIQSSGEKVVKYYTQCRLLCTCPYPWPELSNL